MLSPVINENWLNNWNMGFSFNINIPAKTVMIWTTKYYNYLYKIFSNHCFLKLKFLAVSCHITMDLYTKLLLEGLRNLYALNIPRSPQNEERNQEDFTEDWLEWRKHYTASNDEDISIFLTGKQ